MRTFTKVSARLIAAVLAVASLATVAQAQNQSFSARVKVPFAFETGYGQHFQPGVYTITFTGIQTMLIRSATSSGLMMVRHEANEGLPVAQGQAVFTHYGDKYYLHSISETGNTTRLSFNTSQAEREAQIASIKPGATIELALLQATR